MQQTKSHIITSVKFQRAFSTAGSSLLITAGQILLTPWEYCFFWLRQHTYKSVHMDFLAQYYSQGASYIVLSWSSCQSW